MSTIQNNYNIILNNEVTESKLWLLSYLNWKPLSFTFWVNKLFSGISKN